MCRSLKIQGAFKFLVELTQMWTWKSRIVAIFLLFLTLWHVLTYKQADATLASLSILKYEALKWPHRVIRGSKIKSGWILFKSMSDRRPWLKNSKNVIIFQMRHVVLTLGVVKGQRLVFRLYRGQKIKLLRFSWKWWHIVLLPIGIQKKNSLHYTSNFSFICFQIKMSQVTIQPMAINFSYIISR